MTREPGFQNDERSIPPVKTIKSPVCVIGAGPAGACTALQLNRLGVSCVVVDKAVFPRNKVCGDGLSGKVLSVLEKIDHDIATRFLKLAQKQPSWGVSFISPGRHRLDIPYKVDFNAAQDDAAGYVCKRTIFDQFLVDELKASPGIEMLEGFEAVNVERRADGFLVEDKERKYHIETSLIVIANGAQSALSRKLGVLNQDPAYQSAGVRGYYHGVSGNHQDQFIELHFLKELLPGYLWIFPLPDGEANVGLDMLSVDVSRKKINLRNLLPTILEHDDNLRHRFKNASLVGRIEGYGLPLAGQKRSVSGAGYLVAGDAASMIDPLTGEGIGNAMYAGRLAAMTVAKAVAASDYSASLLKQYDEDLYRVLGSEFRLSRRLQGLAGKEWLFNWLLKRGSKSQQIQELISGMLFDVNLRKKLASPRFYFDLVRSGL